MRFRGGGVGHVVPTVLTEPEPDLDDDVLYPDWDTDLSKDVHKKDEPESSSEDGEAEDDEDAEEQAQILFYTGKERAVSRDRMLRQVGMAKALVNFVGYVRW